MNWRDKWQDKTRGGFEVADIREGDSELATTIVYARRSYEMLMYPDGKCLKDVETQYDLLPITPQTEQSATQIAGHFAKNPDQLQKLLSRLQSSKQSVDWPSITPPAERQGADDCSYCGGPMDEPDGQSRSTCIATVLADATESKPSSHVGLPADLDVSATDQPDLADIRRDAERYRKLQDHIANATSQYEYVEIDGVAFVYPDDLDETVDALPSTTTTPA